MNDIVVQAMISAIFLRDEHGANRVSQVLTTSEGVSAHVFPGREASVDPEVPCLRVRMVRSGFGRERFQAGTPAAASPKTWIVNSHNSKLA